MSEGNFLLCPRVTLKRMHPSVKGSLQRTCSKCGAAVWCSLASLATIAEHGDYMFLCEVCGVAQLNDKPDTEVLHPSEAQLEELKRQREMRQNE